MADGTTIEEEGTATAVSHYEFDSDFQTKIAALTIRDASFASKTVGLIDPAFFENEADSCIVKAVLDHFGKYKVAPALASIGAILKDAIVSKKIRSDLIPDIRERLRAIITADLTDREYVADQVETFAKERAHESALLEAVAALQKRDFAKIERLIKTAAAVGKSEGSGDYDYWEEITSRTEHRVALGAGTIKPDGITTGLTDLDGYLYHGGWGRKELSVFMGAPKAGKSMSLGEFAKNASLAGYNVLYVTLEVSAKIIADRIDANLSDTAMRALKTTPHGVKSKIEELRKKAGHFHLREFPSGLMKPSMLRKVVDEYRAKGIVFDLIVVDYADIMCPERLSGEPREDSKSIYIDLRALAFEENAAVLTATQTNREGAKAATARAIDVAEDFNKIRIADEVFSINATEPEKAAGEARLFFAASRNGESGFSLRIRQDRSKMKFLTKILGRE